MMFDGKKADDKKDRLSLLYEKYGGKMFAAAKRIVGSTSDAEDALHNAFLSVAKRIDEINKEAEGYYVLINFESNAEFPAELDRIYKITDGVLRSMIIKKED